MIKIGKDTKDIKFGNKQIIKVYKGSVVIWEKIVDKLVYSDTGKSAHYIRVNAWGELNVNKNYRFVTNKPHDEYAIVVNWSYTTTIKNNDVFRITKSSDIEIKNINNYYDIKIYEVKEEATIII